LGAQCAHRAHTRGGGGGRLMPTAGWQIGGAAKQAASAAGVAGAAACRCVPCACPGPPAQGRLPRAGGSMAVKQQGCLISCPHITHAACDQPAVPVSRSKPSTAAGCAWTRRCTSPAAMASPTAAASAPRPARPAGWTARTAAPCPAWAAMWGRTPRSCAPWWASRRRRLEPIAWPRRPAAPRPRTLLPHLLSQVIIMLTPCTAALAVVW